MPITMSVTPTKRFMAAMRAVACVRREWRSHCTAHRRKSDHHRDRQPVAFADDERSEAVDRLGPDVNT